jgi:hypothetical protein
MSPRMVCFGVLAIVATIPLDGRPEPYLANFSDPLFLQATWSRTPSQTTSQGADNTPASLPGYDTPGAVSPNVSQNNIDTTICLPGYSRSIRPPYSVTGPLKRELMRSRHPLENTQDFELDHLVPLSIGGAPADPRNLWLEPRAGPNNAAEKDALEFVLWRLVCTHELPLITAQRAIATNWIVAYRRYATPTNLARFHFNHGGAE